jgi:hypothetical protein
MYYFRYIVAPNWWAARLGDWIMKDRDGNPVDAKVLETVNAASQET